MKRIKPKELPMILTEEIINILVEIALEFPQKTFDWADISEILDSRGQLHLVLDRVGEIRGEEEKARRDSMRKEEKTEETAKWKRIKNDLDPNKFYGNMGQPEAPQEYKNRYGVWPPGYNQTTGEKLLGED